MKFCVLLTCFNRKEKTINCIKSLADGNEADIDFIVVDDGSSDGTVEVLEKLDSEYAAVNSGNSSGEAIPSRHVDVLRGDGNLFYSGGMRKAMEIAKEKSDSDFYVLVNDDVEFDKGVLDNIVVGCDAINANNNSKTAESSVMVGAMRDSNGNCSYGGIKYVNGIHYKTVKPDDADRSCDTFNANFVVVPKEIFMSVSIMDSVYRHSLGDFDYGLSIKKAGYRIEVTDHFVGTCDNNPSKGTWRDTSLPRLERIKKKETVKGAPFKQWFHFLNKNFGLGYAIVYSITPYLRILLGK